MAWKIYLQSRVQRLEDELRRLPAAARSTVDYGSTWRGLRDARVLASMPTIPDDLLPTQPDWNPPAPPAAPGQDAVSRVVHTWIADLVEPAYSSLHRADAAFLGVADEVTFRARARDIKATMATAGFSSTDPRLPAWTATIDRLLTPLPAPPPPAQGGQAPAPPAAPQYPALSAEDRTEVRAISEEVNQRLEGTQYRIRRFRDRVVMASVVLAVLVAAVVIAALFQPDFFSLCVSTNNQLSCPVPGAGAPGRADVLLLTLVAVLGGGLAALPLLNQADAGLSPFTLSTAQALLKLPAGAATGLAGLFAVQRGLFDVLKPQPGLTLLAYAIAFGLSQQAVTHFIDARASSLLSGNGAPTPGGHPPAAPAGPH